MAPTDDRGFGEPKGRRHGWDWAKAESAPNWDQSSKRRQRELDLAHLVIDDDPLGMNARSLL